jgi:hypothetical protein
MDSGNYALKLCSILERKGYVFEVTSTPCQISKGGCSYCLRFPLAYKELVLQQAHMNNITIREIYKVEREVMKYKYVKIL